jgi:hypothetical protein
MAHVIPADAVIITGTVHTIVGERTTVQRHEPDPYPATGEPTISEAANLLAKILASGAVARLDLMHDALTIAHRRGRAAERAEVKTLAREHVEAFAAAVTARSDAEFRRDARPWYEQ